MKLTKLQREEIEYLHYHARDCIIEPDAENIDHWEMVERATGKLLADKPIPFKPWLDALLEELEDHVDKFAPSRKTRFSEGDPGDRSTFISLKSLIRKLEG